MATTAAPVSAESIAAARAAVATIARRTPVLSSRTFSERAGGRVALKAENLQRTGSFKVRGAAAKLAALGDACAAGVVCASAGNHGQGVAAAAAALGFRCEVFVPEDAPIAKVEAMAGQGATVRFGGTHIEECLEAALAEAAERRLEFVHPYNDPDIVSGQGSVGLELLEDVPDLAQVVVPIGGGGLISGVAVAIRSARPDIRVVGVRAETVAAGTGAPTIADGISVKHPGELTQALIDEWVDEVVTVAEDEIGEAMVLCMERAKLVVEGAGAASVAAVLSGKVTVPGEGTTVALLSGGNVDATLLATVARRHETQAGRRLVLFTRVPDRPGALAGLLARLADTKANILDVTHVREGIDLHVRETAVEIVLETRGSDHATEVERQLREAGYDSRVLR